MMTVDPTDRVYGNDATVQAGFAIIEGKLRRRTFDSYWGMWMWFDLPKSEVDNCSRCGTLRWLGAACVCVTNEEWEAYMRLVSGEGRRP